MTTQAPPGLAVRLFGVVPSASRHCGPTLTYLASFVMAVLYLADVAQARSLAGTTDEVGAVFWQCSLLLGSIVALVSIALPRKQYSLALPLEAVGAMMIGVDVLIYIVILATNSVGSQPPYATVVWVGGIVPGLMAFRAVGCMFNRGRLLVLDSVGVADS